MAIKDPLKLYDPPLPTPSEGQAPQSQVSQHVAHSHFGVTLHLQPSPARFIEHVPRPNAPTIPQIHLPPQSQTTDSTVDITDISTNIRHPRSEDLQRRLHISPCSNAKNRYSLDGDGHPLLPKKLQMPQAVISSIRSRRHMPVAATAVFSRDAAPLYLPKLDKYLAGLPAPGFLMAEGDMEIFPPMGELAKLQMSLDDLESNNTQSPAWRNRRTILGSAVNIILGFMGSSALASFYSLQGLFNTVQIFALILSTIVPVSGQELEDKWRKLFLGTIPNILALNFASTAAQSLIFLVVFMAIAAVLLYYFYQSTFHCNRYSVMEGLQQTQSRGKQWGIVVATFLLTVIYLPLSTMAVHVLVWSQDLWVVPNPYTKEALVIARSDTPNEFRNPLDFCWTTTMKRNQVNYAPVVIGLSAVVFVFLTIWFPIALHRVIKQSVPKVDQFTELGRPRGSVDMDGEYHRLLSRDRNPFAFMYSGFRRGWGTYQSTYLCAKLSTLVIIAVVDPDNCLFRSLSRSRLLVVRQILLLITTLGFFLAQCIFAPFLDPVNNASEWTSRLNYVTTAIVALLIALEVPGEKILNTFVLYSIYIVTYSLSFYFTIINLSIMQRLVKRLTRRVDFSIDIFSPRLDTSSSSLHTRRRIWQESITTLLLTRSECAIPKEQAMVFAQARDSEFPPYLLNFLGTPGERHVENLKILREVGALAYSKAVALISGPDHTRYKHLENKIQRNFVGPDCYWKNPVLPSIPGCTKFFGNAWWIPFPPTLVIRYDDGPLAVLKEVSEFEEYIYQNSSNDIRRRRQVRLSLRALEDQTVSWPYDHISPIGAYSSWCFRNRYKAKTSVRYHSCVLRIGRRGHLSWNGLQLGSGFSIELCYPHKIILPGDAIGLNDDYDLTAPLAQFLKFNQHLIPERLQYIEAAITDYRHHYRRECSWKTRVLSYQFLSYIYDQPRDPATVTKSSLKLEHDTRVQQLMDDSGTALKAAFKRLSVVSRSETATWWYIFWDDLWRRNHDTLMVNCHAPDFDPYYPTSIAYTPVSRATLEGFLVQRGLFSKGSTSGFFTTGFLNKLYLRVHDTVFRGSSRAIMFHIGDGETELNMEEVDLETRGQPSTLGTGGGTDHNDSWIRTRPEYRWEGLLNDAPHSEKVGRRKWFAKLGAWLGLTPLWKPGTRPSISLDVRLKNGRYILVDGDDDNDDDDDDDDDDNEEGTKIPLN